MQAKWKIKKTFHSSLNDELRLALNIEENIAELLLQRGITDFYSAKQFFRSSLDDLHDPFLMKGMHLAISRINKALLKNEKILIYGDYDVDGTTAVALVYSFFKNFSHSKCNY